MGEFVLRADESQTGLLGDLARDRVCELRMGVEASADRGPPERQLEQVPHRALDAADGGIEHRDISAELLSQSERDGVHEMGPADLDDAPEVPRLACQSTA